MYNYITVANTHFAGTEGKMLPGRPEEVEELTSVDVIITKLNVMTARFNHSIRKL